MDEQRLDFLLCEMRTERYVPSEKLLRRTKAIIRGRRLLQVVLFLSFCAQLLVLGFILFLLTSPEVPSIAKVFCGISLFAYMGSMVVATVAARFQVIRFFRRAERLIA